MDSFQIFISVIVLGVFVIGISAIIITIAENRYNSVIFTADEAKEFSTKREASVDKAIKNLNDRVTAAAHNGTHHITQNLKIVTPSCGDLYLGRVDKDDFLWCVKQVKSYFEGRGYSVKMNLSSAKDRGLSTLLQRV